MSSQNLADGHDTLIDTANTRDRPGLSQHLSALSLAANERYVSSQDWRDLEEAIRLSRLALKADDILDIAICDRQYDLACLLEDRFKVTRDKKDLQAAVEAYKQSTSAFQSQENHHGPRSHRYLLALKRLALETHNVSELDATLKQHISELNDLFQHPGIKADSSSDSQGFWIRTNAQLVTDCLSRRYEITGGRHDFCQLFLHAIKWWSGSSDPANPHYQEPTLEESRSLQPFLIKVSRLAIASSDDSIVKQIGNTIHHEYLSRVRHLGPRKSLAEIARDVSINVEIVFVLGVEPDVDDAYVKQVEERFNFAKSIGATTCQIRTKLPWLSVTENEEESASKPPPDDGTVHFTRNQIAGLLKDFDSSSKNDEKRVDGAPEGLDTKLYEERREEVEKMLQESQELHKAYVREQDSQYLEKATKIARRAIDVSASDEFSKVDLLFKGPTPSGRHVSEIEYDMISHSRARYLLAVCLKSMYQQYGAVDKLNMALDEMQEAYKIALKIPFGKHPDMALIVSRSGLLLRLRFLKFGRLHDLDLAVARFESLLDKPLESIGKNRAVELWNNYALILKTRFNRSDSPDDIDKCVASYRQALAMITPQEKLYAPLVTSLSGALLGRYNIIKDVQDLKESVSSAKQILPFLIAHQEANVSSLIDISHVLLEGLEYQQSLESPSQPILEDDIEDAVRCSEAAVRCLPEHHVSRSTAFLTLASVLETKYRREPSDDTLHRCMDAAEAAWASVFQNTEQEIMAGKQVATYLCLAERWAEATTVLEEVAEVLLLATPRWLPKEDRLEVISNFAGLSSDGAITRLLSDSSAATDTVYKAVRSLEIGRGIILGSTLDYRMAYRSLRSVSEELAKDFVTLSGELDALSTLNTTSDVDRQRRRLNEKLAGIMDLIRAILDDETLKPPLPPGSIPSYQLQQVSPSIFTAYETVQRELRVLPEEGHLDELSERRQILANDFESLLSRIREHDELHDFLRPLGLKETIELAEDGNVVLVSASSMTNRSVAIIINRAGLSLLHLPYLEIEDVEDGMMMLRDATKSWTLKTAAAKNKAMLECLEWLWHAAVKPILDEILKGNQVDPKPRIHWIGTGLLSGAPFHAAGVYSLSSNKMECAMECAMDLVISSYTPTLRALAYTRDNHKQNRYLDITDRFLIISAPQVPGTRDLTLVPREVANIKAVARPKVQTVLLDHGTSKQVMSELPLANFVHFACHGYSNPKDINDSHLILYTDPVTESQSEDKSHSEDSGKLSVREIQTLKSPAARLAYLSACSGAESKTTRLADETIHLASAFQLAGFEHVIGSMWPTKDAACQKVAEEFYKNLFEGDRPDATGSGARVVPYLALHNAVQKLREENMEKPLIWAPFVHYGS